MPLLAGPGTIVTGMNYAAGAPLERLAVVLGAFFLICVATYVCFVGGQRMTQVLGKNFLMVISRLMGLILVVMGAQMLIEGVRGAVQAAAS
jgi:multiple antibiotic resistance protein